MTDATKEDKPQRADILRQIGDDITTRLADGPSLGARLKFDLEGEGVLFIDGTRTPNKVYDSDDPADCTIAMSLDTLRALMSNDMSSNTAFTRGLMRISGEVGVAMRLGPLLRRR